MFEILVSAYTLARRCSAVGPFITSQGTQKTPQLRPGHEVLYYNTDNLPSEALTALYKYPELLRLTIGP